MDNVNDECLNCTKGAKLMFYEPELNFIIKLLKNFHVNVNTVYNGVSNGKIDMGIRASLGLYDDYRHLFCETAFEHNTVYKVTDMFYCCYIFMVMPDDMKGSTLIIGPFTNIEITREMLLGAAERFNIPSRIFTQVEKYYTDIPVITNESMLFGLINTFAERIWGGFDRFTVKSIKSSVDSSDIKNFIKEADNSSDDPQFTINLLEKRYAKENELLDAVSKGLINKAELMVNNTSLIHIEQRIPDPIRSFKNYTIILNTLLRKAAEHGGVHPVYIDGLSSDYAKRIETVNSIDAGIVLQREMVGGYCLLVKEHSMRGYSQAVKEILLHIDLDPAADLSLKKLAEMLNMNPSYLSALFRKETGYTLTEFVTKKRMRFAENLLGTTRLQVQTVAQQCGIMDVNYFTKAFKKQTGYTPTEYRAMREKQ